MRQFKIILSVLSVIIVFSSCNNSSSAEFGLKIYTVSSLEKIFTETSKFKERDSVIHIARGEVAELQMVCRAEFGLDQLTVKASVAKCGASRLPAPEVGLVDYVTVGRETPSPGIDRYRPISGLYPDPIVPVAPKSLHAGENQPIWLSVDIPKETPEGVYKGELTIGGVIKGEVVSITKEYTIKVYPVTIENRTLQVTNWFFLDDKLKYMNNGESVERFSEFYWKCAEELADIMAEYRQNIALVSPLRLAKITEDNGEYSFDFTNFNRMVQLLVDKGVVGRIEGGHIGSRVGDWSSEFGVFVPSETKVDSLVLRSIETDKAKKFYKTFFKELKLNLEKRGWWSIYMQHIADEPIESNYKSYNQIAHFVKNILPEVKIVEACHTNQVAESVDIWVPQLNFMHQDYEYYKQEQEEGDEIMFYTCLAPQGNYANRFIEQPLIKTRLLHWMNYKYNIPGYLHWGLNYWKGDDVYNDTSGINTESGNVLPGGDSWIVYPGYGEIYPSIRLKAMRSGIDDYELLRMVEEQCSREEIEKCKELVRQVIYRFDHYDTNIDAFNLKRRVILEMLSK